MPSPRFLIALASLQWIVQAKAQLPIEPSKSTTGSMATLMEFKLPASAPVEGLLEFQNGVTVPYQKEPSSSRAWFVWNHTNRSQKALKATLRPPISPRASTPKLTVDPNPSNGQIPFKFGDRSVLTYQSKPGPLPRADIEPIYTRGGYIHPIYSPSGRLVSDDFPPNHIHHHGIWSPWTKTEFEGRSPDFWNMGQGKGRVEFVRSTAPESGRIFGALSAHHRFVDSTIQPERTALNERWDLRVYSLTQFNGHPCHIFDVTLDQSCATESALKLPKYHYGGLGFRGHRLWDGAANCQFLASTGETNRIAGNETRANWCWVGGNVEGQLTGIAILCHPSNFRAPQPMRLHPTEPFFCFAPSQLGDWSIEPNLPYHAEYRFVVFDGAPNRDWLNQLWTDYAHPPSLQLTN